MTAQEALKFIRENVWQGSRPGLERTRELLERLGSPQNDLSFVHVAGTNGKGSVCAMLAQILQSAGYKTGLYTSPYISKFNERMQVDGEPISDDELAEITEKCVPLAMAMADKPTEFELVTAIAMEFFRRRGCEVVVLEVGMGGRLDSTNIIENPLCSVITNIGLDHTRELGDTEEKIAGEKAGIIKSGCPTVVYEQKPSVCDVISEKCAEKGSKLLKADFNAIESVSDDRSGQVFSYKARRNLSLPLLGAHQLKNAAVVLETVDVLNGRGLKIDEGAVKTGLAATRWPARFEILSETPFFVVDGGHNPQCAETVAANLKKYFSGMKTVILFGVLADKDYMGLAEILNTAADEFVTITPQSPRALQAPELAEKLSRFGKTVTCCKSIPDGVRTAMAAAGAQGVVCSVGSLYTAGAVREMFIK